VTIKSGDRVEHAEVADCFGTVDHSDHYYVRVKWDDGQIGLLYYDEGMIPDARKLLVLRGEAGS
jgi:hypothetical protein